MGSSLSFQGTLGLVDILQVSYGVAASKVMSVSGRVVNPPGKTIFWQEIVAITSVRLYVQTSAGLGGITSGSLQEATDIFEFVRKKGNVGLEFCPGRGTLLIYGGSSLDGGNYISEKKKIGPKSPYLTKIWENNILEGEKSTFQRTFFGVLRNNTLRVPSSATQTDFMKEFKNNEKVLVLEGWLTFLTPLKSLGSLKQHQNPLFPLQYSCDPSDRIFEWLTSVLEPALRSPLRGVSEISRRSKPVPGENTPLDSQRVGQTRVDRSGIPNAGHGLFLAEDLNANRVVASFLYSTTPQSSWDVFHVNLKWPHDAGFEGARNMYYFDALFTPENPPKWYYINHSCTPNCATYRNDRGSIFFHTLVPVSAGTELTFKYTDAASFCTCRQC
jgi:hypothetical protein